MKKKKIMKLASSSALAILAGLSVVSCGGSGSSTKYTVKFNSNDPDTTDSISVDNYNDLEVKKGSKINLPTLSYEGYTFDGWYTDASFTTKFSKDDKVNSDLTLYAKWTKVIPPQATYSITYNVNGHGTAPANKTGVTAITAADLPVLTADGFDFGGWYTDAELTIQAVAGNISANTTLYAKWTEIIPSTYDVISSKEGKIIATKFDDGTSISTYGNDFSVGTKGFYSLDDVQNDTIKVEVKDEALVITDTDASATAEGIAEIGLNYEGTIEGTLKYTPTVTDNKAPSKWTIVQFYGYKNAKLESSKLFGIRANQTKSGESGNLQVVFEGDKDNATNPDYNYYGTEYAYKVNTELEIYWKYDFTTKKLTVTINGTAIVEDYDVPEANQPLFLTGLGFITGGTAAVRAPKIDDFAIASSVATLDETKTNSKALLDSAVSKLNIDSNYKLSKNYILEILNTAKADIDLKATKKDVEEVLVEALNGINSYPSDESVKINAIANINNIKSNYLKDSGYTINYDAFTKVFTDAEAAINAATTAEEIDNTFSSIAASVAAIKSDEVIRDETINELNSYAETAYNSLDESDKTSASHEYNEVLSNYVGENGILNTVAAVLLEDKLTEGKEAIDDVIEKYQLTLEQYEAKLSANLDGYKASKTTEASVLAIIANVSISFEGVTTKAQADEKFNDAKAIIDDVYSLFTFIRNIKATTLAYQENETAFETKYGPTFTALFEMDSNAIIAGTQTLDAAKQNVSSAIAAIKIETEVNVRFMDGTEIFDSQTILRGTTVTEPTTTPTNDGYVFGGWDFDFTTVINSATDIYAKWNDTYGEQTLLNSVYDFTTLTASANIKDNKTYGDFIVSKGAYTQFKEQKGYLSIYHGNTITFTVDNDGAVFAIAYNGNNSSRYVTLTSTNPNYTATKQYTNGDYLHASTEASRYVQSFNGTNYTLEASAKGWLIFDNLLAGTYVVTVGTDEESDVSVLGKAENKIERLRLFDIKGNQSVITGIKADVVAGNNSFTISNVKLVPQTGSDISISTGYTIEVYDSDGEKVDNENLTAGDYQVIVSYGKYTKEVFDKTIEDQVSPIYSDITYLWVDNQCTATRECTNIPTLTITETVEGVVENVTAASVGHNRVDRLVANFTNSLFETQYSKEFEVPNTALEPVYADTTYLWDGDKCTAVLECTNDSSYTISETVTGVFTEVTAAGIGVNQTAKYIATFLDDKFETQESKIFEVEDTMITEVFTEAELKEALAIDGFSFDIGADIELTSSVTISNSVAINLCENTITTSIYRIVASNEDKDITVLIKNGQITGNTHVIRANQNSMVILEDLTITSTGTAVGSTNGTLIIISANITAGGSTVAAYEGAKVTINSGTFEGAYAVESNSEAKVEINGGTFKATSESGLVASGGTIIVNDGTITSQEFAVLVISEGTATINGGTFATLDNVVVGTNGTEGKGNNTITINDGTFNGNIVSSGYIACGVYVANSDTVEINGGTFNIKNGVGVVARSGNTTVSEDVVFNIVSDGTINSGKVGDATINIEEPHELVIDYLANYPGGEPTLINETEYEVYELKQTLEVESADELTAAFNYSHATIILNADIEYSGSLYIEKNAEVDLNGHTITFTQGKNFRVAGCEVIFKNGKLTGQTSHIIRSQNDAILTLINMDIETFATAVGATNATLIIESSNIVAGDAAVAGYYASNIIIKSGTFNGKNSVVANDYETIIDIQSGTFNGTDAAILSNGGTIAVASGVIISSDNSVEILSNGGTIVNDTNYVVYKLHNVNDETTLNDAMQEPNSYVVLQNDIALTTLNLIHVNGIIVIICGENSITDDGGSIEIGINTVIVTDNASIEVLLEAPEDYAINKKDNLDGTFTYSCIADEE